MTNGITNKEFIASAKMLGFKINNNVWTGVQQYRLNTQKFMFYNGYLICGKAKIHKDNTQGLKQVFNYMVSQLE